MTCLAACELYEEIASVGKGWMRHVQGANQLVAARGPHSLKSELALLLYSNMRHGALLHALISRKAPFMAAPEWRKLAHLVPRSINDESVQFYDVAIQIPGLLQKHDEIEIDAPSAVADIDKFLEESARLETQLRNWWTDWQAGATVDNHNDCELRPIDDFPTFTSLVSDRTIDHAFTFPDFMVAYLYSVCWMVMHYLRSNIQSLQKLRHRILVDWYPEPDDVVLEDELLGYALSLYQCIPFFVEPISNSSGHIGIFMPMRTAAVYFTDRGHWRWLKWIGAVRNNVFVKGLVPPGVKHAGKESGIVTAGRLLAT